MNKVKKTNSNNNITTLFDDDITTFWPILDESIKRFYELAVLAKINIIIEDATPDLKLDYGQNFLPSCINGKKIVHNSTSSLEPVKYYHQRPDFDVLYSRIKGRSEPIESVKDRVLEADAISSNQGVDMQKMLDKIKADDSAYSLLKKAFNTFYFSYNDLVATLKLTRAIGLLAGGLLMKPNHVSEAIQYVSESKGTSN